MCQLRGIADFVGWLQDGTDREQERLQHLVGAWKTEGWTRDLPDRRPKAKIDATDDYEWLPGRTKLLHTVDASVVDQKVEGAEISGFDPAIGSYVTRYFGTDGPAAYEANFRVEGETPAWEMRLFLAVPATECSRPRRRGGRGDASRRPCP